MYEPDDGPLTDEQIEQLKASVDILNKGVTNSNATDNIPVSDAELDPCYKCGTPLMNAPGIGPFCPNKECDIADATSGESISWKYIPPEPINNTIDFVKPEKSLLEQHPYLLKGFDHFEGLKPLVYVPEPVVEPTPEPTVDSVVTADTSMKITTPLPYKELDGDYVDFNGAHMRKDALRSLRPELFMLNVDHGKEVNSDFGTKFPDVANRGDIFTRVDTLPNKVFKYDGSRWIEVNKETSSAYLFNTRYVEYLISAIDSGQYDPELLSDEERNQIEDYLKIQKNNQT
jgi:hypothetical protein